MKRSFIWVLLAVFSLLGAGEALCAVAQHQYPATPYGDHLYRALKNLESRRELRQAEAQRLNIILPSAHSDTPRVDLPKPEQFETPASEPIETVAPLPMLHETPDEFIYPTSQEDDIAPVAPRQGETFLILDEPPEVVVTHAVPLEGDITPDTRPTVPAKKLKSASDDCFLPLLTRFQAKKSAREQEAKRLGITLPSQGGSIHSVSPALGQLHQTIQQMRGEASFA